eukprot:5649646-Pyramimonas_sp.AAC.2
MVAFALVFYSNDKLAHFRKQLVVRHAALEEAQAEHEGDTRKASEAKVTKAQNQVRLVEASILFYRSGSSLDIMSRLASVIVVIAINIYFYFRDTPGVRY